MAKNKQEKRLRTKRGIRKKISGSALRPRISVFRSNKNIYAQLIDDGSGVTLASASSLDESIVSGNGVAIGKAVGLLLAEKAKAASIETVVMDRNGFRFHGRVKALAEGAREGGLKF
ncbi:MAG: 50S ribosomal protein L18 [Bacteroidetes bacterium]|nr:MAG: 50S ribosomal protein L18 [Bacteroidota bacterium]